MALMLWERHSDSQEERKFLLLVRVSFDLWSRNKDLGSIGEKMFGKNVISSEEGWGYLKEQPIGWGSSKRNRAKQLEISCKYPRIGVRQLLFWSEMNQNNNSNQLRREKDRWRRSPDKPFAPHTIRSKLKCCSHYGITKTVISVPYLLI